LSVCYVAMKKELRMKTDQHRKSGQVFACEANKNMMYKSLTNADLAIAYRGDES